MAFLGEIGVGWLIVPAVRSFGKDCHVMLTRQQRRALTITGIALSLILGGAVGNLWDRVARGRVVDFLLFYVKQYQWPVFNLADSAIVVGAGLLIIEILFSRDRRSSV